MQTIHNHNYQPSYITGTAKE